MYQIEHPAEIELLSMTEAVDREKLLRRFEMDDEDSE
jgi:hypothetical protein